ncbi:hypothetical protein NKR23_g4025 [Pleurostoma richardsiae]|uniref:DUF7730 domain-containing protein n=1 Tax=Pleurostoma richardsiae TaxID=41990 RepID=A0AA38RKU4_9PEZI|nr:hypothetical protein NKR23_g4025 [Pleurostoma richardsiae]
MESSSESRLGTCPILGALPFELRQQIYSYALFSDGSFFSLDDEEGVSLPTRFPKVRPQSPSRPPQDWYKRKRRRRKNAVSLMLTCRQISAEAADVLYAGAFFRLRGIAATTAFFAHTPQRHLDQIRSVKLVWDDAGWIGSDRSRADVRAAWPEVCSALSRMRSLQNLYVGIALVMNTEWTEAHYLGALRAVRPRGKFKVCVPRGVLEAHYGAAAKGQAAKDRESYPEFELCRHVVGELCQWRREVLAAEGGQWIREEKRSAPSSVCKDIREEEELC